MISAKKGVLKGRDGSPIAILDNYASFEYKHHVIIQTVRAIMCDLVYKERCFCQMYRATLRTAHRHWVQRNSEVVSDKGSHTIIYDYTKAKCLKELNLLKRKCLFSIKK